MADTVDSKVIFSGTRRYVVRLYNTSDGTGEADVIKVDKSTLVGPAGVEPSKLVVEKIEYDINGMNIRLYFNRTTDVPICVISGAGFMDWSCSGGLVDTGTGDTGDILLTTNGHALGDSYTITLYLRLKA